MLSLEAYKLRDVQQFISLLNQFEAEGVSDVRFVRERLSRNLTERAGKVGRVIGVPPGNRGQTQFSGSMGSNVTDRKMKEKSGLSPISCDCGRGVLVGPYRLEGLIIVRCSMKCGFSKVVN